MSRRDGTKPKGVKGTLSDAQLVSFLLPMAKAVKGAKAGDHSGLIQSLTAFVVACRKLAGPPGSGQERRFYAAYPYAKRWMEIATAHAAEIKEFFNEHPEIVELASPYLEPAEREELETNVVLLKGSVPEESR